MINRSESDNRYAKKYYRRETRLKECLHDFPKLELSVQKCAMLLSMRDAATRSFLEFLLANSLLRYTRERALQVLRYGAVHGSTNVFSTTEDFFLKLLLLHMCSLRNRRAEERIQAGCAKMEQSVLQRLTDLVDSAISIEESKSNLLQDTPASCRGSDRFVFTECSPMSGILSNRKSTLEANDCALPLFSAPPRAQSAGC